MTARRTSWPLLISVAGTGGFVAFQAITFSVVFAVVLIASTEPDGSFERGRCVAYAELTETVAGWTESGVCITGHTPAGFHDDPASRNKLQKSYDS